MTLEIFPQEIESERNLVDTMEDWLYESNFNLLIEGDDGQTYENDVGEENE